jgi:hypothetical protein
MTRNFEYVSYSDADRIAILENRAAELERRLLAAQPDHGSSGWRNVALPPDPELLGTEPLGTEPLGIEPLSTEPLNTEPLNTGPLNTGPPGTGALAGSPAGDVPDQAGSGVRYAYEVDAYGGDAEDDGPDAGTGSTAGGEFDDDQRDGSAGASGPDGRTEGLINHGRSRAKPARSRRILRHWRLISAGAVALLAGIVAAVVALGGGGANWPSSVTTVQAEIKQACENPDVAAEPSGLNFACGKDTQGVLWVYSLLTSGDNPGFVDQSTGRKGLEPIQPSQGGDIAWSLNLHHPYNPANPIDSLQVAARAINNIISGATLTSTNGGALVEPGLESKPANCQRYTGSSKLLTPSGYPARCAAPVTSSAGKAALVSDVFQQWMGGTPSQIAQEAGVLFRNADNPGDSQVQAILNSLPASGG